MIDLRKILVGIFGFTVILLGLALLFLPGPGILTLIVGLIILAGEFLWAKKLLKNIKKDSKKLIKASRGD